MDIPTTTCHSGILEQRLTGELLEAEVTAGSGTLDQKSWSLTRPVTLIGTSRHAHIRVEGSGIEPVHVALLNTADAIILADLNSRQGVMCAGQKVKTRVLQSGVSFRLGTCLLRVDFSAQSTRQPSARAVLALPKPVTLTSTRGAASHWFASNVGTVIGSREGCDVRLESKDVLPQHALLTRVGEQIVLASLAADKSIRINSHTAGAAVLEDGDVLTIWPIVLRISIDAYKGSQVASANEPLQTAPSAQPGPIGVVPSPEVHLAQFEEQILTSARHLQQWQEQLEQYANGLVRRDAEMTLRAQQLDEVQASLAERERHLQQRLQGSDGR